MDVRFRVDSGQVTALQTVATWSCAGDDGCKASAPARALDGSFAAPLTGQSFTWKATTDLGAVTLSGAFGSTVQASGTYKAQLGPCCTAVGAWSADWVPGSGPTGGTQTGTQPAGWGKHSTGTWHPAPPRATVAPKTPTDAPEPQKAAATLVEALRAQLGLPMATQHAALNTAAQGHASFYVAHKAAYDNKGLSPHDQDPNFGSDFTGKNAGDRAKAAGHPNPAVVEIMAFTGGASGAIQGWLETVYHRLPLVHPRLDAWGWGQAKASKAQTEVIDATLVGPVAADLVVYPYPGQTGVPSAWSGNEGPQPPKPPGGYPSGPVITARFEPAVQVQSHELLDAKGTAAEHVWLTATNDKVLASFDAKTVVLYAHKPLTAGVWTVKLKVQRAGKDELVQWSFQVGN
ncbi:MAG: hypothetical protein FJ100_16295 [Deltaproteobacteria bacterium]|nr:hypothetical protein [Deltaproteobacteria bacterium]